MQRVSALLPTWDRSRPRTAQEDSTKRPGSFGRAFGWTVAPATKLPITAAERLANGAASRSSTRVGREVYWPSSLDLECDKAARILKSFCSDGFLAQDSPSAAGTTENATEPPTPKLTTRKIPPRLIQNAVGLAIFSCMRSGLWMSGSGGSGILIARKADGTWSSPSSIMLHTSALGFVLGVDIYDCVLVINSVSVLELFASPRTILGADVDLAVGPLSSPDAPSQETGSTVRDTSVLTYLKARGKFQQVRLDGSLVTERANENERFYHGSVSVLDILAGNVTKDIPEIQPLFEVIKAAEGRTDFDAPLLELLSRQPAPGDAVIETPLSSPKSPPAAFGVPDVDDPDPFGVIALEMAGLEIREAGSSLRPTSSQFEFNPSPTSPVFGFNRQSIDTALSRSNRGSYMSNRTQATAVTDMGAQTDGANTPQTTASPVPTDDGNDAVVSTLKIPVIHEAEGAEEIDLSEIDLSAVRDISTQHIPVIQEAEDPVEIDLSEIDLSGVRHLSHHVSKEDLQAPSIAPSEELENKEVVHSEVAVNAVDDERDEDADDEDEDDEEGFEEEPVIFEVATAAQPRRPAIMSTQVAQVIQAKGSLVTIPKRVPPPLPLRSPARISRASKSDIGDVTALKSPLRSSMISTESHQTDVASLEEPSPLTPAEDVFYDTTLVSAVSPVDAVTPVIEVQEHHQHSEYTHGSPRSSETAISQSQTLSVPHASSGEESIQEPRTPLPEDELRKPAETLDMEKKTEGPLLFDRSHIDSASIAA